MLHEPASSFRDRPLLRHSPAPPPPPKPGFGLEASTSEYQPAVASILRLPRAVPADPDAASIRETLLLLGPTAKLMASYQGELLLPPEEAYAHLDAQLASQNALALLRPLANQQVAVHVVRGRPQVRRRPLWPNLVLFVLTVLSLLFVGTAIAAGEAGLADSAASDAIMNDLLPNLWRGLPYTISLLLILGTHEMGHFFAARAHRIAVTLPYFIPAPPFLSPIGTAGAFIQIREPIRSRRSLLDIGAAGPLCGLAVAIPILFIGLATSPVVPPAPIALQEGNSLLYALAKTLVFGHFIPDGSVDVLMNQLAQAAWTGLLVTALNLIPIGQLDGGHILYSLIGERARFLYYPVLILTVIMVVAVSEAWLFWLILLFVFGRFYAAPLDMVTPLDRRHKVIAVLALVVFVVTFVPIPFTLVETPLSPLPGQSLSLMLPLALVFMLHRLRKR